MTSNWETVRLGDVTTRVIGRTPPRRDARYWTAETRERPFCTIADMKSREISICREGVSKLAEDEGKAKRVPAGSLLLSFKLSLGRVGITQRDLFTNEAIAWVKPGAKITRDYLAIALESLDWDSLGSRAVKGKTLNAESLDAIELALPPLAEQRRIVDLISSLDDAIEAAEEGSLAASATTSRLRESLFVPASASERWIISDIISKHRMPVEVSPSAEYTEIGIRSHGRGTFIKAPVSGEALGTKKVFHMTPGCLVFSVVFSWEGATALLGADCEGKIASHRFPNYKGLFPLSAELLSEYFKTTRGRQLLVDCSPGGAGRNKTLNQTALLASAVDLPLQSEWEQCLEQLASSHSLAESAAAFAASLRKLRGELLMSLLSGAHTIPESYDVVMTVAEELVTA